MSRRVSYEQASRLKSEGILQREIAQRFGVSPAWICKLLKRGPLLGCKACSFRSEVQRNMEARMSGIVKYGEVEFTIIDAKGEKWVTAAQLAEALGYEETAGLRKLIKRHASEFINKISEVRLTPLELQPNMVINYHGVIRAAMLANTKTGREFRDWAEDVLFKVMTQGHYLSPAVTQRLDRLESGLASLINHVQGRMMLAPPDVTHWLTPTERLRQLLYQRNKTLPPRFNTGGSFDGWAAVRYRDEFGSIQLKPRRLPKITLAAVIEPSPTVDLFLLEIYAKYLAANPHKQEKLRLIPMERNANITNGCTANSPES